MTTEQRKIAWTLLGLAVLLLLYAGFIKQEILNIEGF
jgi:hypothetical protein